MQLRAAEGGRGGGVYTPLARCAWTIYVLPLLESPRRMWKFFKFYMLPNKLQGYQETLFSAQGRFFKRVTGLQQCSHISPTITREIDHKKVLEVEDVSFPTKAEELEHKDKVIKYLNETL